MNIVFPVMSSDTSGHKMSTKNLKSLHIKECSILLYFQSCLLNTSGHKMGTKNLKSLHIKECSILQKNENSIKNFEAK
jgi:hypothetical protein